MRILNFFLLMLLCFALNAQNNETYVHFSGLGFENPEAATPITFIYDFKYEYDTLYNGKPAKVMVKNKGYGTEFNITIEGEQKPIDMIGSSIHKEEYFQIYNSKTGKALFNMLINSWGIVSVSIDGSTYAILLKDKRKIQPYVIKKNNGSWKTITYDKNKLPKGYDNVRDFYYYESGNKFIIRADSLDYQKVIVYNLKDNTFKSFDNPWENYQFAMSQDANYLKVEQEVFSLKEKQKVSYLDPSKISSYSSNLYPLEDGIDGAALFMHPKVKGWLFVVKDGGFLFEGDDVAKYFYLTNAKNELVKISKDSPYYNNFKSAKQSLNNDVKKRILSELYASGLSQDTCYEIFEKIASEKLADKLDFIGHGNPIVEQFYTKDVIDAICNMSENELDKLGIEKCRELSEFFSICNLNIDDFSKKYGIEKVNVQLAMAKIGPRTQELYYKTRQELIAEANKKIDFSKSADFSLSQLEIELQTGHNETMASISVSTDGKYLASGGLDHYLIIWDLKTGLQMKSWPLYSEVNDVCFSKDGKYLCAVAKSKAIVLKMEDFEIILEYEINDKIGYRVRFSPDAKSLYIVTRSVASNHPAYMIKKNIQDGKTQIPWQKIHDYKTDAFDVSPDGTSFFTGSRDKTVKVWDAKDGTLNSKSSTEDVVNDGCYTPNGEDIIYAIGDKYGSKKFDVKRWDGQRDYHSKLYGRPNSTESIAISSDGEFLANGGASGEIRIRPLAVNYGFKKISHGVRVQDLCFSADNKYLIVSGRQQSILDKPITYAYMYKIDNSKRIREFNGSTNAISDVSLSENNYSIVSYKWGGIQIWDLEAGRIINSIKPVNGKQTMCAAISSDSKHFAHTEKKNIFIYDEYNQLVNTINSGYWQKNIEFSPDGTQLYTSSDNGVSIFDAKSGERLRRMGPKASNVIQSGKIDISADFTKVAFSYRYKVGEDWLDDGFQTDVWGIPDGFHYSIKEPICMDQAIFSPDNKKLLVFGATLDENNYACLFNAETGEKIAKLSETQWVFSGVFDGSEYIYTGHRDGSIHKYNAQTASLIEKVSAHNGVVTNLIVQDKKYLLSTGEDGKMKMWELGSLKEIATFVAFNEGDYACYIPENYYILSKNNTKGIAFSTNDFVFPCTQFDAKYNRPDLVLSKIGLVDKARINMYEKAYQKRLKQIGFTEEALNREIATLPELWLTSEVPTDVTSRDLLFTITARDTKSKLSRIHVWINDVPIYGKKGRVLKIPANRIDEKIHVILTAGNNKVKVAVQNEQGIMSVTESFDVYYDTKQLGKPDLYVVSIGVSKFTNSAMNLSYAAKDATDIEKQFENSDEFGVVHAYTFADAKATKSNILNVKKELQKSSVEDMVIVFVASHGLLDNKLDYYLATHDVDFNNPSVNGLSYSALEDLLDGIPARKKLMFIDACHSGEVDKEESELIAANTTESNGVKFRGFKVVKTKPKVTGLKTSFELMTELFTDIRKNNGAIVISSAGGGEFAYESSEWNNGVFTYALLEGLKTGNADADKNKEITVSELRDYVFDRVKKLTNGQQNPTSRRENLEFDFRVW
jgi:WD40 repeat protein